MELGRVIYYYVRLRNSLKDVNGNPQVILKIVNNIRHIESWLSSQGIEPYMAEEWLRRNQNLINLSAPMFGEVSPPLPPEGSTDLLSILEPLTIDELNQLTNINAEFLYSLMGLNLISNQNL